MEMEKEINKTNALNDRLHQVSNTFGNLLVDGFHYLALFAIGAVIVWSAALSFFEMSAGGSASIHDILLLFIYLELGAMVGIYFKTNRMPTRFLIYIGITALVRMLLDDIQLNHEANMKIVYISGSIFLLALANLVIRYGSHHYPSGPRKEEQLEAEPLEQLEAEPLE